MKLTNIKIPSLILLFVILVGCGPRESRSRGIYDRASIRIEAGQMAKITHPSGVALVDFTSFRSDGASYRWRFHDNSNQVETAGAGEVKDSSIKLLPSVRYLPSSDTNFYVCAGPLRIVWSYGSLSSATLYYVKGRVKVELLPDTGFETEVLRREGAPIKE